MSAHEPSSDISLPDSLRDLIRSKIRGRASDIGDALLAVACLAAPTVAVVAGALESDLNSVVAQLEDAENRGIIEIDGDRSGSPTRYSPGGSTPMRPPSDAGRCP